jgi:amino acid transporter
MTAGEMKDPRRTVKKSIAPLFWRMFLFFVVNIWLVGMCIPYNDPDLNNAAGTLASPFILAVRNGGSPNFAHFLNALVFITVFSCGITSFYVASRAMTHISDLGIIHPFFGKKDSAGRPWVALLASGILGGGLTYLNLNNTAKLVYSWFSSLVGVASFCNWFLIYLAHVRFRKGLKAQGIDYKKLPFYTRAAPYSQYFGMLLVVCFLAAQLYFAIFPFTGRPSAKNFFATYITVPLFVIDYFGYKVCSCSLERGRVLTLSDSGTSRPRLWRRKIWILLLRCISIKIERRRKERDLILRRNRWLWKGFGV